MEAHKHIKELYGDEVKTKKYTKISSMLFVFCIIGFSLIPLEIFLRGSATERFENGLIVAL